MNERIDVLALQATDSKGGLDRHKFAELIVRECAEVAADVVRDAEGVEFGLIEVCYEHFGVKP